MAASLRKPDLNRTSPLIVHSGTIGTAFWSIDEDGVLRIGEGILNTDDLPASKNLDDDRSDRWPWYPYRKEIDFVDGRAPFEVIGDLSYAFGGAEKKSISKRGIYTTIEKIDLSGWNTSRVTSMRAMFYDCNGLTDLNISNFDTREVTDMADLFNGCYSLHALDVSSFQTSNVRNMSGMFSSCYLIESLDISGFDTSKVTNMNGMFSFCHRLENLLLGEFDTSQVTDMAYLFSGSRALAALDLYGMQTDQVTSMDFMFSECSSLLSLNLSSFQTSRVTTMFKMFNGAFSLRRLNIEQFDGRGVHFFQKMFDGCQALNELRYSAGMQKIIKSFRSHFPKGQWYQNNQGPYHIATLPALNEGESALLSRRKIEAEQLAGGDENPAAESKEADSFVL